ncbi:hypothetical protein [Streptomyces ehimensis]|uniref:Uncharacterized protein n=1 Tax=Streptomyces ehimensis TaxID=68195 RepID=A0ABV9BE64_9ACTN
MVANHARKIEARRRSKNTGESHQAAVRAVTKPANVDWPVYRFDLPLPDLDGAERCPGCKGRGNKIGDRAMVHAEKLDRPVLLDTVCSQCRGCGRAEHAGCSAGVHAGDAFDPDYGAISCWSCGGRRFRYVTSSDEDMYGNAVTGYLRQPCSCAQDLMREETVRVGPEEPTE